MTARYETLVHARNRHSGYGTPVSVLANTRREAIVKAVAIGWNGRSDDAQVTVLSVSEIPEATS